ncbi:MAG: aldehyde ferredoxin oxidoreductase family protein [Caldisericaceae bacterium]
MDTFFGYAGKILRVNLTTSKISAEELNPIDARTYLGGAGLAAKILFDELPKGIEPLSAESKIIFATGPLTATFAPGSGSVDVCFKSPLTDIWGESRAGSDWGPSLKKAGYDLLIIEGKSSEQLYLTIDNGNVSLRSAKNLVGLSTSEKTLLLKKELGNDFEIATIGPAGEAGVLYSTVMFGDGSRAAGRTGAGAVLGSKNLLAVAVRGTGKIKVARENEFHSVCTESVNKLLGNPGNLGLKTDGTTGDLGKCDNAGDWPTKNWHSNSWGKGQELYDKFKKNNLVGPHACYKGCILFCGRIAKVDSGKWKTPVHEGTEYESISAFTAFIMNDDIDAAVYATYLCNEYGLDTISAGAVIAFAMECYEKGILSKEELNGLDMSWGNMDSAVELLNRIVSRDGIGDLFGKGVVRAARVIGKGSEEFAVSVKGLEGPAHDPRSGKALALTYGVGNIGMSHIHPIEGMAYDAYKIDFGLIPYGLKDPNDVDRFEEKGKGTASKILHDFGIIPDVIGLCKFYVYAGLTPDDLAKELSALTGWDIDGKELLKIGERIYNLERVFDVREGITSKDDQLPQRVKNIPEFGKYASVPESAISNYDLMLNEYYESRGWDSQGIPTTEKLAELGLGWTKGLF